MIVSGIMCGMVTGSVGTSLAMWESGGFCVSVRGDVVIDVFIDAIAIADAIAISIVVEHC